MEKEDLNLTKEIPAVHSDDDSILPYAVVPIFPEYNPHNTIPDPGLQMDELKYHFQALGVALSRNASTESFKKINKDYTRKDSSGRSKISHRFS